MTAPATVEIAVIGAGPAGLMAAERLARLGHAVTVFDRMPTPGRKLLMAGRGGLNLTHSEPQPSFRARYGQSRDWLAPALDAFPPDALIGWANGLEQATFVGTSGRVFPKAMKASPLLRAWLQRLDTLGVALRTGHRWTGWTDDGHLRFEVAGNSRVIPVRAGASVLALGGASWPRLGSDGRWIPILAEAGVAVEPLAPANMGLEVPWSAPLISRFEGHALKRIAITIGAQTVRGEAVITARGLEGGAIYAVAGAVRDARPSQVTPVTVAIDLRPDLSTESLATALTGRTAKQSTSSFLARKAKLAPAAVSVLHEGHGTRLPTDAGLLAAAIKAVPLRVTGTAGLDRAISSAGGVRRTSVNDQLMLLARPGVFVAGEMLDWEAPTGGYLLQATFATAAKAAAGVHTWLAERPRHTAHGKAIDAT